MVTKMGVAVGSPAYMSPEQCRSEPNITPRSDLYACGVLLFEMLTGRSPILGDSPIEIAMGHVRTPAPPLSSLVRQPHPGLEALDLATQRGERSKNSRHHRTRTF